MTSRKILIVDDDTDLSEALIEQLSLYDEFELQHAASATTGIQAARDNHVDLIVMDVGLPDMDGREAVKLLRKGGVRAPIIMLTGHDTDSDAILGLEAGANDYVVKPFRFAVLLARIRAHLRQHEQSEDATFSIGHYTFRPAAKLLLDPNGGKDQAHREGDGDPQISLPRGRPHRDARRAALGGVGLQFRRHDAHAGDAHLSAPAEDRARSLACRAAGDRVGRLQAGAVRGTDGGIERGTRPSHAPRLATCEACA